MTLRALRTSVEPETFTALQALADQAGVTISTYARSVLAKHTTQVVAKPEPAFKLTRTMWAAVHAWVKEDPDRLARYPGATAFGTQQDRRAFYAWAVENGFLET